MKKSLAVALLATAALAACHSRRPGAMSPTTDKSSESSGGEPTSAPTPAATGTPEP